MKVKNLLLCSLLLSFCITFAIEHNNRNSPQAGLNLLRIGAGNNVNSDDEDWTDASDEEELGHAVAQLFAEVFNQFMRDRTNNQPTTAPTPLLPSQILSNKFLQAGLGAGLIKAFPQSFMGSVCLGLLTGNHLVKDFQLKENAGTQKLATGVLAGLLLHLYLKPTEEHFAKIITTCGIGFTVCQLITNHIKRQRTVAVNQENED